MATGVAPRIPKLEGIEHPKALSYIDVLRHKKSVGLSVAIMGAGGIGFDVAEYLSHGAGQPSLDRDLFLQEWGIDSQLEARGGIDGMVPKIEPSPRKIFLLQRKTSRPGASLGKTTGWIHRTTLKNKQVTMISGVAYQKIDDQGLHITVNGAPQTLEVEHVIICAGQEPLRELQVDLEQAGISTHLIGGANVASELDAKRAINEGSRLAAKL